MDEARKEELLASLNALDDEEKAVVEMLYRILSSLNEEQVDDVLKQFEKEIIKQAAGNQSCLIVQFQCLYIL